MSTELTVIEEAVVALGMREREQELVALVESSKTITTITNPAGYQQVHAARMVLKNERVQITKLAKEARDRANAFCKACISEERRIIGLIEPEEKRLEALQKTWDDAREAERRQKAEAEARRVADIQARIENISSSVLRAAGKPSAEIWVISAEIESLEIDEGFAEFRAQAETARAAVIERLREMSAAAEALEAEQARIQAEREELARLRADQARREAEEAGRREAEEAELRRQREEIERQAAAERARIAEEERQAKAARDAEAARQAEQLRRQREEEARAAAERQAIIDAENARIRSEQETERRRIAEESARLAAERAESERKAREAREAQEAEERRIAAERAALEREQREAREAEERKAREQREREEAEAAAERKRLERRKLMETRSRPDSDAIVQAVADAFDVDRDIAAGWLYEIPKTAWKNLTKREAA